MKESIRNTPDNALEVKIQKYQQLVRDYLGSKITVNDLFEKLSRIVDITVEDKNKILDTMPKNEPFLFISNHAKLSADLCIETKELPDSKHENKFNYPKINFPAVRQLLLKKALGREFVTVALDIGWSDSIQTLGYTLIENEEKGGRTDVLIQNIKSNHAGQVVVIYPEGGATGDYHVKEFKTGYYFIAKELGIKKIVLGICSPMLSIEKNNSLKIFDVIDILDEADKNYLTKEIKSKIENRLSEKDV